MNKKPVLLRTIVALVVLVIFAFQMHPLKERDFYDTFRTIWIDSNDTNLKNIETRARELQAADPLNYEYPSEAIEQAAAELEIDMTELVEGQNLADNRDVIALVRTLSRASIRRGLDLNGGAEFIMRVTPDAEFAKKLENATPEEKEELQAEFDRSRDMAIEILRTRLESKKIYEVEIYPMGADLISLRIPVVSKAEKVRLLDMIKMSAQLRFHLVHENNSALVARLAQDPDFMEPGYKPLADSSGNIYFIAIRPEMNGDGIVDARPVSDQFGQRKISLRFDAAGTADFGTVTKNNVGRQLAIVLDGQLYCAPALREPILNGAAEISGRFSTEELQDISDALMAGGMKYQLEEDSVFDTDPLLGADNIRAGIISGIISLLIAVVFLIFYYRLGGAIVAIALACNVILLLGAMAAFNQTLTMPGIAGIILTIGMAVDINVLIFERIREEQNAGKPLSAAIEAGYSRVWPVVLDSNLTGFFTAIILLFFGTGAIKGFAITFAIGIVSSMFTGVFITHLWCDYLVRFFNLAKLKMTELIPANANINYMRFWKQMLVFSAILIICTGAIFAIRGKNTLSIDFTGGTMITMICQEKLPTADVAEALREMGYEESRITYKQSTEGNMIEILLRQDKSSAADNASGLSLSQRLQETLNEKFPNSDFSGGKEDVVSGLVGWEFSKSAIIAIVLAFIMIAAYISFRYEFAYAMAGLIALIHDVIIVTGIYLILGKEISLNVIAALLTIIGYSINDTIVVFDRIRENLTLRKDLTYIQIISLSLNQTMPRTLLTSFTTFLVLIILFIFGGAAINDFVLVMLLGVIVGTYSSIFIASPLVALWHRHRTGVVDGDVQNTANAVKKIPSGN